MIGRRWWCCHPGAKGLPMTLIEAMGKARAVVAPRITAIPEMVADGGSGLLFTPGSAADLSPAVEAPGRLAAASGPIESQGAPAGRGSL